MPHRVRVSSGLAVLLVSGLAGCAQPAAGRAADRLAGSWELQSRTVRRAGGDVILDPVLGQQPIGRIFYDASGHMALQMMRVGRAQAIGEPTTPGEDRSARVILGYDAYFGTFTIDETAGTITHHVEGSLFPEDLGKDFTRQFRLDGDTFELSFVSGANESAISRALVFRRSGQLGQEDRP